MKKFTVFIYTAILLFVICGCIIINSENCIAIHNYNLKAGKLNTTAKFVLISDLHNKEFGKDNQKLVEVIKGEKPDFIAVCGDMVSEGNKTREPITKLLSRLCDIAPVYYALGNHERSYYDYEGLVKDIESRGAVLLDNEMVSFDLGEEKITIGGITDFPYYEFDAPDYDNESRYFLDSFIRQEKENYSILLAHQPELYFWGLDEKDIDLMVSGHTHGGLVSLPFMGGLCAPNQGWFPEYDMGYYSSGTANMIVTSGLGNDIFIPRFNNPPEVCVININ